MGTEIDGAALGVVVGNDVLWYGLLVGIEDGNKLGEFEGFTVGLKLGTREGEFDGEKLGEVEGEKEGPN